MGVRYVIIDYMHLVHKALAGDPLSTTVTQNGELVEVDTTIPTYTIKNVVRYGQREQNYVGVCFEGGSAWRKEYFNSFKGADGSRCSYKGNRPELAGHIKEGTNLAINCLYNGNVSCYRMGGYEADDLIASLVYKIKQTDTLTPIDIVTNDADLLPLVDEQVSVYKKGTRQFALAGCPELRLYYQVTPDTMQDYLACTSEFKTFHLPYNSILLYKLIRGDKSDGVPMVCKGYGGVKFSALTRQMEADGVDFPNVFRYNKDFPTEIAPTLLKYFDAETVGRMEYVYNGINLKIVEVAPMRQISIGLLQAALNPFRINL